MKVRPLVSTLPAYLNALEGKGVHIVTVNDYLAKRDADGMGQVHEIPWADCRRGSERHEAGRDAVRHITVILLMLPITNLDLTIFVITWLSTRSSWYSETFITAIIDEVDSVLIDEARTPLIISGQSGKSTKLYEVCDILAQTAGAW